MVTQYDHGKKYIMELIEQSVAAYDQREELGNKIQNLSDKQGVESSNHMQEIRELQRKLDHDAKLHEFFAIKGNRRVNAELEAREADRRLKQQEHADEHLKDLHFIMHQIQVEMALNRLFLSLSNDGKAQTNSSLLPKRSADRAA